MIYFQTSKVANVCVNLLPRTDRFFFLLESSRLFICQTLVVVIFFHNDQIILISISYISISYIVHYYRVYYRVQTTSFWNQVDLIFFSAYHKSSWCHFISFGAQGVMPHVISLLRSAFGLHISMPTLRGRLYLASASWMSLCLLSKACISKNTCIYRSHVPGSLLHTDL